jgi:hypothetical protein
MSLISEALKRQQMEREGKELPAEAAAAKAGQAAEETAPVAPDSQAAAADGDAAAAGSGLSLAAAAASAGQTAQQPPPAAPVSQETDDDGAAGGGLSLAAAAANVGQTAQEPPAAAPVAPAAAPPPPPPPPPPMEPTVETAEEPAIAETVMQEGKSEDTGAPAWAVLTGAITVIAILVGGAVWGGIYAFKQLSSESDEPAEATGAGTPTVATLAPVTERAPDTSGSQPSPAVANPEPVASTDDPQPSPLTAPAVATPDPPDTDPPVAVEPPSPQPPPQPVARVGDVTWPRLSLSGLVGGKRGGAAIINNEVIGIGEAIEGAVVIDLTKKGATLEYQGEKQFLRVGGVIE